RLHFGANPRLWHLLSYASCSGLPLTREARFRPAARESNPLDRPERFQLVLTTILPPALLTLAPPHAIAGSPAGAPSPPHPHRSSRDRPPRRRAPQPLPPRHTPGGRRCARRPPVATTATRSRRRRRSAGGRRRRP